jgi:hypothetical protein
VAGTEGVSVGNGVLGPAVGNVPPSVGNCVGTSAGGGSGLELSVGDFVPSKGGSLGGDVGSGVGGTVGSGVGTTG